MPSCFECVLSFITNVLDIVSTIGRGFNVFPFPRDKMESQIHNSRATTLAIPDVSVLPSFEGKVNELIEGVFLIFIDIKNIRLIGTGQIALSLIHTM